LSIDTIEVKSFKLESNEEFSYFKEIDIIWRPVEFQTIITNSTNFIKSYGSGSLATLSMRGGTSNQVLAKWNDIPISNPMLGISDLSLVPISFFESFYDTKGGYSLSDGNGAMTGVLHLQNSPDNYQTKSVKLNSLIGSFGKRMLSTNFNFKINSLSSQTKLLYDRSINDFSYQLSNQDSTKRQDHAYFENRAFMQNLEYQINPYNQVKLDIWLQKTFREIPPTTVQSRSEAEQSDQVHRFLFSYNYNKSNLSLNSQIAYMDEDNDYIDPLILIETKNRFKRVIHQSDINYAFLKGFNLKFHYQYNKTQANTEAYKAKQILDQWAVNLIAQKYFGNFKMEAGLGKEWNQNSSAPLSPILDLVYFTDNDWYFKLKLSREFRLPTLNELFWLPGGNIDLLPEEGWNQELNLSKQIKSNLLHVNFFHRKIDNWILWALGDNGFNYSVRNLASVRSFGAEINNQHSISFDKVESHLKYGYAYIKSENQVRINNPNIEKGDQLFYTPVNKLFFDLNTSFEILDVGINGTYTSSTIGINDNLDPYFLFNAYVNKELSLNDIKFETGFSINNILNTDYRVIERRPMPGRHFTIHLNFKFEDED